MDVVYEATADIGDNKEYIANFQNINDKSLEWPHFHEGIEILCFTKGNGEVCINNEKTKVAEKDFVVVNSKQIHSFKTEKQLEYYYIILKKEFLKKHGFPYKEKYVENKFRDEELLSYFYYVCDKNNEKDEWFKEKAIAYLVLLTSKLYSVHQDKDKTIIGSKIKSKTKLVIGVMDYINENVEKNITLESVSQKLGYSKHHVCRVFKELTGKTVTDYINSLKCQKAASDLKYSECTVFEIASKYGYENFSYFSKVFKKYMKKTPSQFR